MIRKNWLGLLLGTSLLAASVLPNAAQAFCGFYVSGADASLYNNATMVVLLRDGTRTVLSMQNSYQGPPEDFALVIPVPVVLQKENVKTLDDALFAKIDRLAAPRLVEYWEEDPCAPDYLDMMVQEEGGAGGFDDRVDRQVRIEAQFQVGEYDVVVLGADESTALDTWLRQNNYKIPEGAEPFLRPYVQSGQYFFVAKVNAKRVKFKDGQATLSPLRFHYDAEQFSLPIRLGLINAKDSQDLLVHVLARGQRYEVANYPNVTIPTNIEVGKEVKERFGHFYLTLLDSVLERNPKAVITEYAWDAASCDPCPGPTLDSSDLLTLGADVVPGQPSSGYVLTRLHARYSADDIGEDLVFQAAQPIMGGRQVFKNYETQELEQGAQTGGLNNFQGRYIIWHPWEGEVSCKAPSPGRFSVREGGVAPSAANTGQLKPKGVKLEEAVRTPIPELGLTPKTASARKIVTNKPPPDLVGEDEVQEDSRCATVGVAAVAPAWMAGLVLLLRRRRSPNP